MNGGIYLQEEQTESNISDEFKHIVQYGQVKQLFSYPFDCIAENLGC